MYLWGPEFSHFRVPFFLPAYLEKNAYITAPVHVG